MKLFESGKFFDLERKRRKLFLPLRYETFFKVKRLFNSSAGKREFFKAVRRLTAKPF